jgi:O-acetyl-ADP-ribose deacetylase (regulator of RNase III)
VFIFGLKQLNNEYAGEHLWFPKIGCGIGGGNWERVEELLLEHLKDCEVTVVVL